ncbi:MAG: DUF1572 family protein [Thermoanaerobaculia bacterium]
MLAFFLRDALSQFRGLKRHAEKAMAQVSDEDFFATLDPNSNSVAVIVKHIAGNLRSRWSDFLTSDGEKPDRRRDSEFELEPSDTRAGLLERWEAGWRTLFAAIEPLSPEDLAREVSIRGEPHTVMKAINRQLTHYAEHIGQIVLLAKHLAGDGWQTLSIERGKSEEFTRDKLARPEPGAESPK